MKSRTKTEPWILIGIIVGLTACGTDFETDVNFEAVDGTTRAVHSWASYHWARTTDNFPLPVIDSVTSDWDGYMDKAVADWSASDRLDQIQEAGDESTRTRRRCNAPDGKVRVCNLAYGNTGWLGLAGISVDSDSHIVKAYTKLNDTYFSSGYYNTDAWKQSVTCQELGHDIGLDHQDVDFYNESLKSCMDYQDPPWPDPNAHDYEQLDVIYSHLDSYNSYDESSSGGGCKGRGCNKTNAKTPAGWGVSRGRHGQLESFIRDNNDGTLEITSVIWAMGH